jgi:hypothetical protein
LNRERESLHERVILYYMITSTIGRHDNSEKHNIVLVIDNILDNTFGVYVTYYIYISAPITHIHLYSTLLLK